MRKEARRNLLYDRLHKGGVLVCLGLTLYGSLILGNHMYNYFKYGRPKIREINAAKEAELLAEGASDRLASPNL